MSDDADDSYDSLLASMNIPVLNTNEEPPTKSRKTAAFVAVASETSMANCPTPSSSSNTNSYPSQTLTSNKPEQQKQPLTKIASTPNHILVHSKQRGNPLLKAIRTVPWEFADIVADYVVGATTCILFLSLKYHALNPDYIHGRLKQLGKMFELRVLLVQCDTKEPHGALKNLTRMCLLADLTLMLAWNADEAGRIVETYKRFEHRPADWIQERADQAPHQKLVAALTVIKPVNKTDAMTLLQNFGSLATLVRASEAQLTQCPGLGPRKAVKLYRTFNEKFLNK